MRIVRERIYINDFCEDLNHKEIILYIRNVDPDRLRKTLNNSAVNKIYRLDYALSHENPATRNYVYISNCELHDLSWPIHEYVYDGYQVYILKEDADKYYVETGLLGV